MRGSERTPEFYPSFTPQRLQLGTIFLVDGVFERAAREFWALCKIASIARTVAMRREISAGELFASSPLAIATPAQRQRA
jgi:hypothetical protein